MNALNRRQALNLGTAVLGGILLPIPSETFSHEGDDELLLHEVRVLEEIDQGSFDHLQHNLEHVTEEELDWQLHPQANTLRWVVGHLIWFEEWVSDAIEETGMYLDNRQGPASFQEHPFSRMKERFTAARQRYVQLTRRLKPADIRRPAQFVYNKEQDSRWETDVRTILRIHATHFAGHHYQVRYIRGTYSRTSKTDKARFDPW